MKILISSIIMLFMVICAYAQTADNQISIVKKRKYYQNGEKLKWRDLKNTLSNNAASAESFKLAQKNSAIGSPLVLAGSALLLAAGITSLTSSLDEANALEEGKIKDSGSSGLGLALGALGCIVAAVPFNLATRDHLHNAIDQYNAEIKKVSSSYPPPAKLNLIVKANGLGLRMTF